MTDRRNIVYDPDHADFPPDDGDLVAFDAASGKHRPVDPASFEPEGRWVPLMDGYGNVITDSGTGEAIMAYVDMGD